MTTAHINAIGTAVPPHEVHDAFAAFVRATLDDPKQLHLFDRMAQRSGIERRFSFIEPEVLPDGRVTDTERFYAPDAFPSTAARMERYERWAPDLAVQAVEALSSDIAGHGITHLVVASCTGFVAPGIDQLIVARTGIDPGVERTVVGFMGCYAAVNALRSAHHIVRSEPRAKVLVVTIELCTLHFQRTQELDAALWNDSHHTCVAARSGVTGELAAPFCPELPREGRDPAPLGADVGTQLLNGGREILRRGRQLTSDGAERPTVSAEVSTGSPARDEREAHLVLVALEPEHLDEADLGGVRAMGAAARGHIEALDLDDPDVMVDLRRSPQREAGKLLRGRKKCADGAGIVDEIVHQRLGPLDIGFAQ